MTGRQFLIYVTVSTGKKLWQKYCALTNLPLVLLIPSNVVRGRKSSISRENVIPSRRDFLTWSTKDIVDRFFGECARDMHDTINHHSGHASIRKMFDNKGEYGGVQNRKSRLLSKRGRYPHLSNATEEHLSGPPRAGRKGIRIEVCNWVCATTHAAEELLYLPLP